MVGDGRRHCGLAEFQVALVGGTRIDLGNYGMFRIWGFKILCSNPSPVSAFGVQSPHLQFSRVNKLLIRFKPHILKHHIAEDPKVSNQG